MAQGATERMPANWRIVHVIHSSPAARLRLIANELPLLVAGVASGAWFFVDVPLQVTGITGPGLEIGIQHDAGDAMWAGSASAWLAAQKRERRVVAGIPVPESLILRTELFFGKRAPPSFADALSVGTARTAQLLRASASTRQRVPGRLVREEIAETYAALIPAAKERRAALELHIAWLTTVASREYGARDLECFRASEQQWAASAAYEERLGDSTMRADRTGYEALRDILQRQSDSIAAHSAMPATTCWASIVARLVHTQVLRLWGPGNPRTLQAEVALLRVIACSLAQDTSTGT
jgi:hypothetical protein